MGRPKGSKNKPKNLPAAAPAKVTKPKPTPVNPTDVRPTMGVLTALENLAHAAASDGAFDPLSIDELENVAALGASLQEMARETAARRLAERDASLDRLRALAALPVNGTPLEAPANGTTTSKET
jgi:hypothetical protein